MTDPNDCLRLSAFFWCENWRSACLQRPIRLNTNLHQVPDYGAAGFRSAQAKKAKGSSWKGDGKLTPPLVRSPFQKSCPEKTAA
mgnify:FL=1